MSGEPKLTCHYCGAECEVEREMLGIKGLEKYTVDCTNPLCRAIGPDCDTPEAAHQAHARVMRVPEWSRTVPFEGDTVLHRCKRDYPLEIRLTKFLEDFTPCPACEFAAYVPPAEPAEGGAK